MAKPNGKDDGKKIPKCKKTVVKNPRNPWLMFLKEVRPRIKARNPGISVGQIVQKAAKCWKAKSEADKDTYRKKCGRFCPTCKRVFR